MATPTLVGGVAYRNTSDATTRNLALSGLVDNSGATVTIADGDFLLLFVFYASSSTTNSVTGLTGLTKLDDNVVATGGGTSTVYYKQNCVASTDAAATLAIATSTSNRTNAIVVVYRNVPATGTAILGYAKNFGGPNTSSASPTATPSTIGGVRVEGAFWATSVAPTTIPAGDVTLTAVRTENTGTLPGHVGSMSNFGAVGTSTGNVAHNLTPATTTTAVGGTTWTTAEAAGVTTKWTIILAPTAVIASVRPASTISSTSVNLVGTAGTIVAALSDESDTTLAETTDDPIGVVLEEKFATLGSNARVGLNSKLQTTSSTGSGSVTFLVQIRQGASTVICSHTVVVAVTDGIVPDTLLGTTTETAAITDWTDLRARWTMTKV
jgi:hypothetical protein